MNYRHNLVLISMISLLAVSFYSGVGENNFSTENGNLTNYITPDAVVPNFMFNVSFIVSDSNEGKLAFLNIIKTEFEKIGIGVSLINATSFSNVIGRTIAYPTPDVNGIPTYDDGGYDIATLSWFSSFTDVYPLLWHSDEVSHIGMTNYQYFQNSTYDELAEIYSIAIDNDEKISTLNSLQAILSEEIPSIPISDFQTLVVFNGDLKINDGQLRLLNENILSDEWKDIGIPTQPGITVGHASSYINYQPILTSYPLENKVNNMIWQGLYGYNPDTLRQEPLIADGMPVWGNNYAEATIHLKNGVTFADGTILTADHVVETYNIHQTASWGGNAYNYITQYLPLNSSVVKIDNNTVKFIFNERDYQNHDHLTLGILPTHVWGNNTHPTIVDYDYNTAITNNPSVYGFGTGPFKFLTTGSGTGNFTLTRNSIYWNGPVQSDNIDFKNIVSQQNALDSLKLGIIDIVDDFGMSFQISEVENLSGITYRKVLRTKYIELTLNNMHPVFGTGLATPLGQIDNSKAAFAARCIRKAMSHAIPRQRIIDEVYGSLGLPATFSGTFGQAKAYYDPSYQADAHNLQKSRELMACAGYDPELLGLPPLTVTETITNTTTEFETITETKEITEIINVTETINGSTITQFDTVTITETTEVSPLETPTSPAAYNNLIELSFLTLIFGYLAIKKKRKKLNKY